jgi:hypothetical protein
VADHSLITRTEEEVDGTFTPTFYEVKAASGRVVDPLPESVSAVACFADTAAVAERPELAVVDADGARATGEGDRFEWGYVCPSESSYRAGLLETIADAAEATGDVRLDDVGFPGPSFCRCERCETAFADSEYDDRADWRAATVESFLAGARERVPGDLYVGVYPDPYPGHLRERTGLDAEVLETHADEVVVPLYDTAYATTYWLEALAGGFVDELAVPVAVEVYAADVDLDGLVEAVGAAENCADRVVFGYDAGTATAALRRRRAEANAGDVYGPE